MIDVVWSQRAKTIEIFLPDYGNKREIKTVRALLRIELDNSYN